MHLTPRETEKLMLHYAGIVAGERLQRGLKLNYPEAIAYISSKLLELARDGKSVADLMSEGRKMLSADQVLDGVAEMIHEVQLEATSPMAPSLSPYTIPFPPPEKSFLAKSLWKTGSSN